MSTVEASGRAAAGDVNREPPAGEFKRVVGASQFFTIGFGCIVGLSWIVLMGDWLKYAGPIGASLAFVVGAGLMMIVGVCYAEIAPMFPVSGGEMVYAYEVFGLRTSYVVGWAFTLFGMIVVSYVALSAAWILDYLIPGIRGPMVYSFRGGSIHLGSLLVALGIVFALGWMNYRGVKMATGFQGAATYAKLVIAVVFIGAGLLGGRVENLKPLFQTNSAGSIWPGFIAVLTTTVWCYGGFNSIPQVMEERSAGTPLTAVGRVMLWSIFVSAMFYCMVILAVAMVHPWGELVTLDLPTASAFRQAFRSPLLSNLVLLTGLLGTFTVGNASYLWGTRVLFALGRGRFLNPGISVLHAVFGSPARAVVLVGVGAACAVFLGRQAIVPIVNVGGDCLAMGYFVTCMALIRLRWSQPWRHRPYRARGGVVTAAFGAAGTLFMLLSSIYQPYADAGAWPLEWWVMLAWGLIGWFLWVQARHVRTEITEAARRELILGGVAPARPSE